ncbi:leucyl/phenylalanyl-tRNA--protein transferase [Aestuariivirga litoralis]|uniref:leucyl/phenylalanyl-tRNA--protein transferase n=1 Tax=Aestuariivirga litoralis TaxID=2650924 RepID=UPI0018C588C3|nr:leucyl/phenylalanyl-tRNA--protein transferase [Aestuariivirga litoralis]MBG1231914.1 leucyl/phenylalanyl-tRNA--protein transferase [Aestuariivirga litoralis]
MTVITPQVLLKAYSVGVFPMAESADDPSLYWVEPDERGLIPLDAFHISHSLKKSVRHAGFEIRIDTSFEQVMRRCAEKTPDRDETWINERILKLYTQLHRMGCCHSVEAWREGELVGGLYGVRLGSAFFGESMFSRATDASKVALVHLVARLNAGGFNLLDAQFLNSHLQQFGCYTLKKPQYRELLDQAMDGTADFFAFKSDRDPEAVLALAAPKNPA